MRKLLYKILLAVNIAAGTSLILSYLSVHINPAVFALPAFFGLAYPYILLVNIILAIIWAVRLRPEALISLVLIVVGFPHFRNYLKMGKQGEDKTGTFKLLSYNVRLFNQFEGKGTAGSENLILDFLRNQNPDILCLQEFYISGNPRQKEQYFARALGGKYHSHLKVLGSGRNRYYGIATFSRFPVAEKGDVIHPESSSLSIYTDVIIEKDTFRIFNNHLQSFRLKRVERSFLNELTGSSAEREAITEIRSLYSSLRSGFALRATQARLLKDNIDSSPHPVIVTGDFNDTPVSYSYRRIRKGLNDSFVKSGSGAGFTYRGNYPPNRIDYILYDNALESRSFDIIRIKHSDHYPVIAYLRKRLEGKVP